MVCDTEAAGLGVLGVVMGWAKLTIVVATITGVAKYFLIIMCFCYSKNYENSPHGCSSSF
jgi:hypothetical protein